MKGISPQIVSRGISVYKKAVRLEIMVWCYEYVNYQLLGIHFYSFLFLQEHYISNKNNSYFFFQSHFVIFTRLISFSDYSKI